MKILFQGDSITDAGRNREDYHDLGKGYPLYAAENIKKAHPDVEFEFIDLGIGGSQTKDLVERLENDFINIRPDIVSILIGVNDTWHHASLKDWIPNEVFEERYRTVLTEIKNKTNAKIMMIEPFLGPVEDKLFFREDLNAKIDIVRKLALEFADVYLPLDGLFYSEFTLRDHLTYLPDGVHPSALGAEFVGDLYAKYINPLIEDLK